jgi:hypothetical protein
VQAQSPRETYTKFIPLHLAGDPCVGIAFLFPGAWNYEFCVTALNGSYNLTNNYMRSMLILPGNLESPQSTCLVASEVITPGIGDCPAPAPANCGWGAPGNGGDGSGQPGIPGGGSPGDGGNGGGGGGGGGSGEGGSGGSGDVYIDPVIWREPSPRVTCTAPCTFILPPKVLPTFTTISFPPYTTDLEIVWTSNGQTTRSFQTTTLTLPPITTRTISFYEWTFNGGMGYTFSPIPKIYPSKTTVTNDKNPEVTRTITPSPYPTSKGENDDEDDNYGGPYSLIPVINGPPGPICSGGCGIRCLIACGGGGTPCIPLITCPRGSDFQDPADPDKDNDDDDDEDDDDDDDDDDEEEEEEDPSVTCPFPPLDSRPPVNPTELGPDAQIDIRYGEFHETDDDQWNNPGDNNPGDNNPGDNNPPSTPTPTPQPTLTPTSTPTPEPAPAPATQRLWVFYMHYIDGISNRYEWQFFTTQYTTTEWSVCSSLNAVICSTNTYKCREAPDGNLEEPPWPTGRYTVTRGPADDCVYSSDGKGPGSLKCPNKDSVSCKDGEPAEVIDCPAMIFANDYYLAVTCDW